MLKVILVVLKIRTADDPDKIEKKRVLRRFGTSKDDKIYKLIEEKDFA